MGSKTNGNHGPELSDAEKKMQTYFTSLAPKYNHLTGYATQTIIEKTLASIPPSLLNSFAVVHDNACGPGTATRALLAHFEAHSIGAPTIIATDHTPAMIAELQNHIGQKQASNSSDAALWRNTSAEIMDSHQLKFKDETFTWTFCNLSVQNFSHPVKALREIHRTLKANGVAVITCWKDFGFANIINEARRKIKGEEEDAMQAVAGADLMREGVVPQLLYEAGWEKGRIKVREESLLIKDGQELDGALEFLKGPYAGMARTGFTDHENDKWNDAIEEAVAEAGGIQCAAWVVFAKRWDNLCA